MKLRNLLLFFVIAIFASSCNEDNNLIGGSIRPSKDEINVFYEESLPIKAYSYMPDSFRTDLGIKGYDFFMLGGLKSSLPEASEVRAHFALQFWSPRLDSIKTYSDSILVIDSVQLFLIYKNYYGDTAEVNAINVYELNQDLSSSKEYYSNENPLDYYSESDLIGSLNSFSTIDRAIPDSVRNSSDYLPYLKIPINKEIGERIFDNLDAIKNDVGVFRELLKGIYVKSVFGQKTLFHIYPYINSTIYNNYSALRVSYHYEKIGVTNPEIKVFYSQDFPCNNECAGFNVIRHKKGTYSFDTSIVAERLYLQGLATSNVRLQLPSVYNFESFKPLLGEDSSRIAINSAKLILKIDTGFQDIGELSPPSQLLLRRDTVGGITYTTDEFILQAQNSDPSGFTFGLRTNNYTYEFNLAEYIQELLDNNVDNPNELILSVANNRNNPSLVFLKGIGHSDNLKLEIVYTRY